MRGNKEQRIHYRLDAETQINQEEMKIYNVPFAGNTATCRETFVKGKRVLEYRVVGDITMEQFIEKPVFRDELVEYMYSISKQMASMLSNGLSLKKINFDLKLIYLKLSDFSVQMIYLPLNKDFPEHDEKEYIKEYLSKLVYANALAVECANQIIDFIDSQKEFDIISFNSFVKKMREESRLLINNETVSSAAVEEAASYAKTESEILYAETAARNADIARMQTENEAKRLAEYAKKQALAAEKAGEMKLMAEAARIQAEISKQTAEKDYKKYSQTAVLYADRMEEQQDSDKIRELDFARVNAEKAAKRAEEEKKKAESEAERLAEEVRIARDEEMRAEEARARAEYEARRNSEEAKRYAVEVNKRNEEIKRLSENRQLSEKEADRSGKEKAAEKKKNASGKKFPVLIRESTGENIPLNKQVFCIGRAAQGVDYVITDNKSVSRRHVYITNINDSYYLRDNESTNHTYLNDEAVLSNVEMRIPDNSEIVIANEKFIFKNNL